MLRRASATVSGERMGLGVVISGNTGGDQQGVAAVGEGFVRAIDQNRGKEGDNAAPDGSARLRECPRRNPAGACPLVRGGRRWRRLLEVAARATVHSSGASIKAQGRLQGIETALSRGLADALVQAPDAAFAASRAGGA